MDKVRAGEPVFEFGKLSTQERYGRVLGDVAVDDFSGFQFHNKENVEGTETEQGCGTEVAGKQ